MKCGLNNNNNNNNNIHISIAHRQGDGVWKISAIQNGHEIFI